MAEVPMMEISVISLQVIGLRLVCERREEVDVRRGFLMRSLNSAVRFLATVFEVVATLRATFLAPAAAVLTLVVIWRLALEDLEPDWRLVVLVDGAVIAKSVLRWLEL